MNDYDRTVIGRGLPVHIGGFSNTLKYRGFDLNIFFQWSYGNDIVNANRLNFETGNKTYLNQFASFQGRWTPENTTSTMPRAGGQVGYVYSTRIIEDGSYLRFKTAALGYTLSSKILRNAKIKSCRFYLAAQNLYTWTNYTGSDPEVSINYSALTPGFDYSGLPTRKNNNRRYKRVDFRRAIIGKKKRLEKANQIDQINNDNNMMRRIFLLGSLTVLIAVAGSCKKFLTKEPNFLGPDSYY